MKIIRFILGKILLLLNAVFSPTALKRTEEAQQAMDEKTRGLALYQFDACPFCIKIRRVLKRQNLKVVVRDVLTNPQFEQELITGGGKRQVPCLQITNSDGAVHWLYESSAIKTYLEGLSASEIA